jgi:NAD(P)H-quinone oxidoreductase subunit 6
MNTSDISFVVLSIIAIFCSIGVVCLPNLVYSAFLLGAVLFSFAGFYILLNADFIAAAQILLYVGAINILILFAIMLVNKPNQMAKRNKKHFSVSLITIIKGAFSLALFLLLSETIHSTLWLAPPFIAITNSVSIIGRHIFSDFLLPFELISVLLLVALIGAIILAKREQLSKLKPLIQFTFPNSLSKEL